MNRFKNILNKSPIPLVNKTQPTIAQPLIPGEIKQKNYDRYLKTGPELMITRILMIHGPLQNKQMWRIYTRMLKQNTKKQVPQQPEKIQVFNSLAHMKKILRQMRLKQKVKSAGYNKKMREHLGWRVQQKKALKMVHPQVIQEINKAINSKDLL